MFSLSSSMLSRLLLETVPSFQATCTKTENLGFGFIFYSLARACRPGSVVIIGSKAGFSVLSFALGVKDNEGHGIEEVSCHSTELKSNEECGKIFFVDPSYSIERGDPGHWYGIGRWDDAEKVEALWDSYGVAGIVTHHKMTSRDFAASQLCPPVIDMLYIDGDHSYEGVRHDLIAFYDRLSASALVIAHDVDPTLSQKEAFAGGFEALQDVGARLYEFIRLPIFPGLAILRKKD